VLTTQCYHEAAGVSPLVEIRELHIVLPDLTVLVTCEEQERPRRMMQRGLSYNDGMERRAGFEEAFLAAYRRYRLPEGDTTSLSAEEAAALVLALLGR
jgi:thymidylate kinase